MKNAKLVLFMGFSGWLALLFCSPAFAVSGDLAPLDPNRSVDFSALSQYLGDRDMDILFGQESLKSASRQIQNIREAWTVRKIRPGEDLCDLTADNLISDSQSGVDSSAFIVETKSGEETEFRVEAFSGHCELTVSYPYSYDCQSCGTHLWGRWNPVVSADCDSLYADTAGNLICEEKAAGPQIVNLNYLRFLNRHKECFADLDLYHPRSPEFPAESTFYKCVYEGWEMSQNPLSLCSLNQLIFERSGAKPAAELDFWTTDFKERYRSAGRAFGFACVSEDFIIDDRLGKSFLY